jgi:hypothetical protein
MESLVDLPIVMDEWDEQLHTTRWRIPLLPSRPIGWLLALSGVVTAALCAVIAASAIERWVAVRGIYQGNLEPADALAATQRWTTYSGAFAVAAVITVALFTIWSEVANRNAHRLAAVPDSVTSQAWRILVGGAFLAGALMVAGRWNKINITHLGAVGLAIIGLMTIPASFSRLTRVANQSTVLVRPFRGWRASASLAYISVFASQLIVHQRWELSDLSQELSVESLMLTAAERAPVPVAPSADLAAGVTTSVASTIAPTTTLPPTGNGVGSAIVDSPALRSMSRVGSHLIEHRLIADGVAMSVATLAIAVTAAFLAVGVTSLDRRHLVFSNGGITIREAKSLV